MDTIRSEPRDAYIDTARGIACTLLVAYHAIGSSPSSGLHVGYDSVWRYFADLFIYFRMPMFAFIAGYIYGARPVTEDPRGFIFGKARRLLLPMFTMGTIYAIADSFINSVRIDWITLYLVPTNLYWFLQSLFVIFLVVTILESLGLLANQLKFVIVLAAAISIQLTVQPDVPLTFTIQDAFGLNGALYLAPYFLCGLFYFRFRFGTKLLLPAVIIFIGAYGYATAGILGYAQFSPRCSIIALLIGITGPLVFLQAGWKNRLLAFIGANSYAIYLLHFFFTSSNRIVMHMLHIEAVDFLVVAGTAIGILGPVLVAKIARRFPTARTAFLGERWPERQFRPSTA